MTPIFAADWLNISINLLLVFHVIICLLLALVVLMQRPKQEGLGAAFGAGLTDQAFGARTTDVLQKGTVYLGTLFFVVTLILAILIGKRQKESPNMAANSKPAQEETTDKVPEILKEEEPVVIPKKPDTPAQPTPADPKAPEKPAADAAPKTTPEAPAKPGEQAKPEAPAVPPVTPPAEPKAADPKPAGGGNE